MNNNYNDDDTIEWSTSTSFAKNAMQKRKEIIFFPTLWCFFNYSFLRFFNGSCSLFLWSFMQRTNIGGNKEMIFEEDEESQVFTDLEFL
jgi:hypothetical protein